jgi:hypothetical protein
MQTLENSVEPYELLDIHFGRKLNSKDRIKDRLIIKHLRRRKNNFLFDFDEPQNDHKENGDANE